MTSQTFVLLSGCLTFGAPLVLAVRELLVLRPGGGSNWGGPYEPPEPPPLPESPPATRGRLPDCLIPKPIADLPADRVLELLD